ncbi:MAG TPA: hypothetical protein VF556_13850 [Pyrinomonadaceae bacterium]|jgi:hypothetical protein
MKREIVCWSQKLMFAALTLMFCASCGAAAPKVRQAIIGSVEAVDKRAKTVAVKTADGTIETIKFTGKTTVRGLKDAAKAIEFAGREGSFVVAHYTIKGADKTASAFEYIGREAPKIAEGTIKVVGKAGRTVALETADGAEEVFDLSERAAVDTGKGIADAAEYTAKETVNGTKVSVHYTEEGGRKVAHFIRKL